MLFGDFGYCGGLYFIGIGGVSMSALARLLSSHGVRVRGSDAVENRFTRDLRSRGIPVSIGEWETITEDTVVHTGAIPPEHPQLRAAMAAKKRVLTRAQLLGEIAGGFPHVYSVAGCHGKTTATSMLAHVFRAGEQAFTAHIGGEDADFGNLYDGGGQYFITEACEFKRSFLELRSEVAVILNTDRDHTDCYPKESDLEEAYRAFAANAETVIVCADERSRLLPHALDFGIYDGSIRAEEIKNFGERYAFTVSEGGMPVVRIRLRVPGRVHIYNALAAYSAARLAGLSGETIREGLENFRGVRRRFETMGTLHGATVIADYAHHPRELAVAIETAERLCEGRLHVVFQPHTYTRTRDFFDDFVEVLGRTETPIVFATYAAREHYDYAGSAARLVAGIPSARYAQTISDLVRLLSDVEEDDLVLFLGAGDLYDRIPDLLGSLPES